MIGFELVFDADDIQIAYKGLKFNVKFEPQADDNMDVAPIFKCARLLEQIARKVGCEVDD
jgi:hypothetical protein